MRKILWMISGIVSAFLSGMFLYEGGKLFFWFYDRRGGVIVLAAGCAVFILFIWSMIRFSERGQRMMAEWRMQVKRRMRRREICSMTWQMRSSSAVLQTGLSSI